MLLGCVADDFTGASDAASFLQAGGAKVLLSNGIPREDWQDDSVQAVIIALKTRTIHAIEAVNQSLAAFRWLKSHGACRLYFKYCSTFDSTEKGNIGPVLDAVLEEWNIPYTLLCPTLLDNGRLVKDGILYVNGVPLAESTMRDHPLTPMRDSRLKYLMERQSRYLCHVCPGKMMNTKEWSKEKHYYLIPDYYKESHGRQIVNLFGKHPLLSGGSGLLRMLAESWEKSEESTFYSPIGSLDPIILAGSCSKATREQIRYFQTRGGKSYKIYPLRYATGLQTMNDIKSFLEQNQDKPVLLYTSASPNEVNEIKKEWNPSYGILENFTEQILADVAAYALKSGRKKIVTAGGETSGAVMQRLGFSTFSIGPSISPGVPVLRPIGNQEMSLVLKSGNFGGENFFVKAVQNL